MSAHRVVILGAGAAGTSAARALADHPDLSTTIVGTTGEAPYSRMLIKGVAHGMTPPEFVRLPLPEAVFLADTVEGVDTDARRLRLASGALLPYDSLIIATGSRARGLDSSMEGAEQAKAAGTLLPLHSLSDAVSIRDAILARGKPMRVAIYGAGLTASETASTLRSQGHHVTLIARSELPGIASFGRPVAEQIAAAHRSRVHTFFGRTIKSIHSETDATVITLDDATDLAVDLIILAIGTTPLAPSPWHEGVNVDERLRVYANAGVYAAGGVAMHHDDLLGAWRIDHWDDAVAQGTHAARSLLHALARSEDPGPYRPRSAYMAMVYGQVIAGAGYTGTPATLAEAGDELISLHEKNETVVGVSGVDAVGTIYKWGRRLHELSV